MQNLWSSGRDIQKKLEALQPRDSLFIKYTLLPLDSSKHYENNIYISNIYEPVVFKIRSSLRKPQRKLLLL